VITYHDAESEHRYYAVEPELDRFERDLLDRVVDDIRDPLLYREGTGRTDEETLRTELEGLLEGTASTSGWIRFTRSRTTSTATSAATGRSTLPQRPPHRGHLV